jgi:hypothetical protein
MPLLGGAISTVGRWLRGHRRLFGFSRGGVFSALHLNRAVLHHRDKRAERGKNGRHHGADDAGGERELRNRAPIACAPSTATITPVSSPSVS